MSGIIFENVSKHYQDGANTKIQILDNISLHRKITFRTNRIYSTNV